MFPRVDTVPFLTTAQMLAVDRAMVEDLHIELLQMMENAGRNLAHLARARFLDGDPVGKEVVVLGGRGGNGGGAMACARRLHAWGAHVRVLLATDSLAPATARQRDILQRMGVPVVRARPVDVGPDSSLIVDGLIGYSLSGPPRGGAAELIHWANADATPVLALDVPSGLDATSGAIHSPVIRATATMTIALPKAGLRAAGVADYVGELYVADIGVPPSLYAESVGITLEPLFAQDEVLRVW
jgi:NAD(P)H-hydrate epimerase